MIDIEAMRQQLAQNGSLAAKEISTILNELAHFREAAAYLAECHAATLEHLPKAASKFEVRRMNTICIRAVDALRGEQFGIIQHSSMEKTIERCELAIKDRPAS